MIATQSQQWDWDVPPTCTNICPYSMHKEVFGVAHEMPATALNHSLTTHAF